MNFAKSSDMYSPLLNNYTVPANTSGTHSGDDSSEIHGAEVYDRTDWIITNLQHFKEYSIEVAI